VITVLVVTKLSLTVHVALVLKEPFLTVKVYVKTAQLEHILAIKRVDV
jgi:hypothetical protein